MRERLIEWLLGVRIIDIETLQDFIRDIADRADADRDGSITVRELIDFIRSIRK